MRKPLPSLAFAARCWVAFATGLIGICGPQSACRTRTDATQPSDGAVARPNPSPSDASAPDHAPAGLDALVRANLDAELALHPTLATWLGAHDYDDKLDDVRTDAQLREATRLRQLADQLRAMDDENLARPARLDRKLLLRRTEAALHELSELRPLERSPLFYVDIAQAGVDSLVLDAHFDDPTRGPDTLRSLNGRLWKIRGLLDEARRNLRASAAELSVRRAIDNAQALRAFLGENFGKLVQGVPDARLIDDARAASGDAGRALDEFIGWLQRDFLPRAHGDLALGPQRFWDRLRLAESIPGSLDVFMPRLEAAIRDAERRVEDATRQLAPPTPQGTRPDPLRLVEDDHFKAEELLLKTQQMVEQLWLLGKPSQAQRPTTKRTLLPVPPLGLPRVVEMPPQLSGLLRLSANAPLEKRPHDPVVYLDLVPRGAAERARIEQLRALNRATLLATLTHEVLGHFLVSLARRQAPTLMQRISSSAVFDEGFATYAERLVLEEAYPNDARLRWVVERNAQLRLLRLLATIKFHAQGAKFDDIVRLFSDELDLDDYQARKESERVALDPMAGAEALGRMELDRLRTDWQATHEEPLGAFHAALLSHGGIPIEALREELLTTP
jgi:uncharacterized protein (DUF885 family)